MRLVFSREGVAPFHKETQGYKVLQRVHWEKSYLLIPTLGFAYAGWQVGQKKVPRARTRMAAIGLPQRGQGSLSLRGMVQV